MRNAIFALALLLAALAAPAADRKYVILSLVGDRLMIVEHQITTGTRQDSNLRQYVDLATPALDNAALIAIEGAVKKAQPGATTVLLAVRERTALRAQEKALETDGSTREIIESLAPTLAAASATHLILVTKERHETMIPLLHGHTGSGYLEGMGFYIDRTRRLTDSRTGERYVGYLAPFAYFRVSMVDLASPAAVKEERVYASFIKGNTETLHPWDSMTAEQKVNALQGLLARESARVVPALLPAE